MQSHNCVCLQTERKSTWNPFEWLQESLKIKLLVFRIPLSKNAAKSKSSNLITMSFLLLSIMLRKLKGRGNYLDAEAMLAFQDSSLPRLTSPLGLLPFQFFLIRNSLRSLFCPKSTLRVDLESCLLLTVPLFAA
jgi:hypothetical protein